MQQAATAMQRQGACHGQRTPFALSHAWALRLVTHEIIHTRCANRACISQRDSDAPCAHDHAPSMHLAESSA